MGLGHWAGVLLARARTRCVLDGRGLTESKLHFAKPSAPDSCVLVSHVTGNRGQHAGSGIDVLASLIQIGRAAILGQPTVHGGQVQKLDEIAAYNLNRRNVGNVGDDFVVFGHCF